MREDPQLEARGPQRPGEPEQRRAEWQGRPLGLTPTEFNLLEVLAAEIGQVVPKEQLSRRALGREIGRYDRSIDVHVCSIRHKLGSLPDGSARIRGIRGLGYQLVRDLH